MPEISLHKKQQVVFHTKANEVLYGGSAGSGKSFSLRAFATTINSQIPKLQTFLFRRYSADIIANHFIGPGSFPEILEDWGDCCRLTFSPHPQIKFSNDSIIHCRSCQYEQDKYKMHGPEIHVLLMDELTHFSESMYRYFRGRCRVPQDPEILEALKKFNEQTGFNISLPFIFCGTNPGNIGHQWVKQSFVDVAPPLKITQMPDSEGGMRRQYIPAKLSDNPSLNEEEYTRMLSGLGNAELVRAMLEGDWNIAEGAFFADLWNNDIHIINPFPIPKSWRVDRSFDWGSSHPFSVCWYAESDGTDVKLKDGTIRTTKPGDIFMIAELYGWNGKANQGCRMLAVEIARKLKKIEDKFPFDVKPGPADSSIFSNENGNCIADDMATQGVKWTRANKASGSVEQGCEMIRRYLGGAMNREDKGLYFFNTCRHAIRTLPTIPRDDHKPERYDSDSEDHIADALRYRLLTKVHKVKGGSVAGLGG